MNLETEPLRPKCLDAKWFSESSDSPAEDNFPPTTSRSVTQVKGLHLFHLFPPLSPFRNKNILSKEDFLKKDVE